MPLESWVHSQEELEANRCGICGVVSHVHITCRHGREYLACQEHIGEQVRTALAHDGRSGLHVEATGALKEIITTRHE